MKSSSSSSRESFFSRFISHWYFIGIFVVLALAAFLRFYQLGIVPHGMTWDEAAIGYNGYALVTTREDEWLVRFPISLQSFGDYKAPFAIYLNGFFTYLLGMKLWAVRLPFAIAAVGGVLGMILLVKQLWRETNLLGIRRSLALVAGLLIAFSPWHFHFSRAGFESGMALTFVIWGVVFLHLLLHRPPLRLFKKINLKEIGLSLFLSVATAFSFVLAIYTYHSAKIVIPLLVVVFLLLYLREALSHFFPLLIVGVMSIGLLVPFVRDSLWGPGAERLTQASVFGLDLSQSEMMTWVGKNFLHHFSPSYLIFGETITLRHGDGKWGVLLYTDIGAILLAIAYYLWHFHRSSSLTSIQKNERKIFWLGVLWIVIGTIPAAIGRDIPHSNRALLALPGFILLVLLGLKWGFDWILESKLNKNFQVEGSKGEKHLLLKAIIGTFIFCHFSLFLAYAQHYFSDFARASTADFSDGYLEAMQIAKKHEKEVDKILFSSWYGQPYIYAIFVRRTHPEWYAHGSLIKYEFTDQIKTGDRLRNNTLIVATPNEIAPQPGDQLVYGADGSIRFIIVRTPKQETQEEME